MAGRRKGGKGAHRGSMFEGMHGVAMPGAQPSADYAKDATTGLIRVEPVYMEKRSMNPTKWQKRWFVLSRNYIVYRKNEDVGADEVSTSIDLRTVMSITAPKTGALAKDEFCFQLKLAPAPTAKKQVPVVFRVRSKSKTAAARWAAALLQRKSTRRNSMDVGDPEPDLPPRPTAKAAAEQEEKLRATEAQLAALKTDARRKSMLLTDLRAQQSEGEAAAAENAASAAEARAALATAEVQMKAQERETRRKSAELQGMRERLEAYNAAQAALVRKDGIIAAAAAQQHGEIERLRAEHAVLFDMRNDHFEEVEHLRTELERSTALHAESAVEVETLRSTVLPEARSKSAAAERQAAERKAEIAALRRELDTTIATQAAEREESAAAAAKEELRKDEQSAAQLRALRTELAQSRLELSEWGSSSSSSGSSSSRLRSPPARMSATDRAFARALSPRGHAEVLDHILSDALGCALEARAAAAMASTGGDSAIGAMWRRMAAAEEALLSSTDAARAAFSSAHFERNAEQRIEELKQLRLAATSSGAPTTSPLCGGGYRGAYGDGDPDAPAWAMSRTGMAAWESLQCLSIAEITSPLRSELFDTPPAGPEGEMPRRYQFAGGGGYGPGARPPQPPPVLPESTEDVDRMLRDLGADPHGSFAASLHRLVRDRRGIMDAYAFGTRA